MFSKYFSSSPSRRRRRFCQCKCGDEKSQNKKVNNWRSVYLIERRYDNIIVFLIFRLSVIASHRLIVCRLMKGGRFSIGDTLTDSPLHFTAISIGRWLLQTKCEHNFCPWCTLFVRKSFSITQYWYCLRSDVGIVRYRAGADGKISTSRCLADVVLMETNYNVGTVIMSSVDKIWDWFPLYLSSWFRSRRFFASETHALESVRWTVVKVQRVEWIRRDMEMSLLRTTMTWFSAHSTLVFVSLISPATRLLSVFSNENRLINIPAKTR